MTISDLIGRTISRVEKVDYYGHDWLIFHTDAGQFSMGHEQICCESVTLEDGLEDVLALTGLVVAADERTEDQPDEDGETMWTFYRIATPDQDVTLRWCGSSNGYYSVCVDFIQGEPS